jgi:uncharacterized protein YecE (DUF72 family)
MASIYIGTPGYAYREWLGAFYPKGTKSGEMLPYYARHFNAVEINNTFYQLPSEAKLETWKASVGTDFRFAVKANQAITHRRGFGIPGGQLEIFLARTALLGERLGPLLFQFPPHFGDMESLLDFIKHLHLLSRRFPITPVVEVRHPKLLQPDIFAVLHDQQIDLCINDENLEPSQWPDPRTVAYLRLRNSEYSKEALQEAAGWLKRFQKQEKDGYVF